MSPIAFRIEPPILRVRVQALHDQSEMADAARRAFEDPAFAPGLHILAEVAMTELPSTELIRERAKLLEELAPRLGSRIAVVVSRDVEYGLGRMLGTFVEEHGIELRMFRDVAAAEAWLRSGAD